MGKGKKTTLTLLLFVKIDPRHEYSMNFHPSSGIIVKIALYIDCVRLSTIPQ